jgi:hypothetical protein
MARAAILQPEVWPRPLLTRPRQGVFRFKGNTIVCKDKDWSITFSGSSWRIDSYVYRQGNRTITFGGEGATSQWDIFIPPRLKWDDGELLDDCAESQVLNRITAAIQSMGFNVGFFFEDENDRRIKAEISKLGPRFYQL